MPSEMAGPARVPVLPWLGDFMALICSSLGTALHDSPWVLHLAVMVVELL